MPRTYVFDVVCSMSATVTADSEAAARKNVEAALLDKGVCVEGNFQGVRITAYPDIEAPPDLIDDYNMES